MEPSTELPPSTRRSTNLGDVNRIAVVHVGTSWSSQAWLFEITRSRNGLFASTDSTLISSVWAFLILLSGRREGCPSRPPTPPCVRVRTRRFERATTWPRLARGDSGGPTVPIAAWVWPRAYARRRHSTRLCAPWPSPCARVPPTGPTPPAFDTGFLVDAIAPTRSCGGVDVSIDPANRRAV